MAGEDVERRLAAILCADVVGYSRLMEADEVGTLAQQRQKSVRDLARLALVSEAARQARHQAEPAVRQGHKQRPAVRRDIAARKIRLDPTATTPWKFDLRKGTIRHRRAPRYFWIK